MNNKKFSFSNLFEVVSVPLFIYLLYIIIMEGFDIELKFLDYSIYFRILGFLITVFVFGFSGYNAAKLDKLKVKPWFAGLIVGFIGSVVSLGISIVIFYYFPQEIMNSIVDSGVEIVIDDKMKSFMTNMMWIGGIISIVLKSGFGALFGFIGGSIGKK